MTTSLRSPLRAPATSASSPQHGPSPLRPLLSPSSIAVIGASRTPGTMGHELVSNLVHQGFNGPVYPVNPHAHAICSVRSYRAISEVPERVDLGVIVVPKELVVGVAEECGKAGVRGLVVISAGFREIGTAGSERERQLVSVARRYGMRMVGPNCMGIINASPPVRMNATFAPHMPPFGGAAFVSQSGALGVSVLDYAREYGIGISQFVSVGNKPDVSGNDLLEAWEHDETVKVILMYVENFGNPQKFLRIASRISMRKPIIVVKSGRTPSGARAAASHTGAMAASDNAVDALLEQAGVLRARTIEELFDIAMAFGVRRLPRSRRTAIVTNAGGPGILAADAMEGVGLDLAQPMTETISAIKPLLPAGVPVRNPLDLIASATPDGYYRAISSLLADPIVDCVVPIFIPPLGINQDAVARAIVRASEDRPGKPVLAVLMGRQGLSKWRADLHEIGIPTYVFPESAARAIAALNRYRELVERGRAAPERLQVRTAAARGIIQRARAGGRTLLTELESLELLKAYGVPVPDARCASTRDEAVQAAAAIGFPAVMKVMSPDISHKTDAGGVVLDVVSEPSAAAAWDGIMAAVKRSAPASRVDGVLVSRRADGGRETIIGFTRDRLFGPLVMFGLGGIYAEVLRDVAFRIAPLTRTDASELMTGIRGTALLGGIRGQPPVNRAALEDVILRIGQLAVECPEVAELDVNPLLAFEKGVVAVDCRVVLSSSKEDL